MKSATETSAWSGIAMGPDSGWPTQQAAAKALAEFSVPYEARVVSVHRTPGLMFEYAATARERGLRADQYIARIFGQRSYLIPSHVERLPERLPQLYAGLTR